MTVISLKGLMQLEIINKLIGTTITGNAKRYN